MFVLGNFLTALARVLGVILNLWSFVILVAAVLSWIRFDPYSPVVGTVQRIADVLCDPIRRLVPMQNLGIDLSPLLAILLLQFTNEFVVRSLRQLGESLG